ncbi:hypothetical protein [Xanthomarina sp. F2636L]|uniref:hypothetical protein n=1 Tax=Xanthomarina sp. F2636L TaxID=2996018 RepID=UPI00225E1A07|nr:hypothetical protein [Xanthomarina sp. F2636L]MCX7549308.1 hypothetical protein [Xanthomarina sp. F2636L]
MTKKLSLLIIILFTTLVKAQDIVFTNYTKDYIPSEIVMNNGTILNGYIKDFTLPKSFEFRTPAYDFSSIESKLNLDKQTFKFKRNLDEDFEKLGLENIHSIVIMDSDTVTYEKLKLKTINTKNEVVDLDKKVMMPLIREAEINLYGLRAYNCLNDNNCEMMYVIVYIKNINQEFAYIPIDFNRINIFNLGKIDDKFIKSFKEAGSDCPAFLTYLDEQEKSFGNKDKRKANKEKYKNFKKKKKEKLKLIKGSKNKQKEEDKLDTEFFLEMYIEIIDEYSLRCND